MIKELQRDGAHLIACLRRASGAWLSVYDFRGSKMFVRAGYRGCGSGVAMRLLETLPARCRKSERVLSRGLLSLTGQAGRKC